MEKSRCKKLLYVTTASLSLLVGTFPVKAAEDIGEIIVTSRKRQESILKVPAVVTAVSGAKLESLQMTEVTDLPKLVPGLLIAGQLLSIGPQITIRGVGTSSYDPGVDQSISLNVDGLSLGQGLAFASGMFDVGQVEVLKGPQSLFYGKSSPGGVISLRTADPTSKKELTGSVSYGVEEQATRGELVMSGPLSETLGGRVAIMYNAGKGYFENKAAPIISTGAVAPNSAEPRPRDFLIRGTLLWKPQDDFSARLKITHTYDKLIDQELAQLSNCPDGAGQTINAFGGFGVALGLTPVDPIPFIGGDDCKFDRDIHVVYLNPARFPGIPNDGVPYLANEQNYATLEMNYNFSPELTLTSQTSLYQLQSSSLVNPTHTTAAAPTFAVTNRFHRYELTQEFRLNSDYSGPLNFTAGAFYEDGQIRDRVRFYRNTAYVFISPAVVGADILNDHRATTVNISTYSLFGQARYKVTSQIELAAGVRWQDETRQESVFNFQNNTDLTPTLPRPKVHASNFSPEATITYTPTDDLTAFASYKKGYKSGSFKLAVPAAAGENNAFNDEQVQGYEIGLKSRLAERSLLANLAWYDYKYRGLQVGGIEPAAGGVPIIKTVNAGRAHTYGVDLDVAYKPPSVEGLSLNASINWNHGRYDELNNLGCYADQLVSQGCNQFLNPNTGRFTAQQLSGTPMVRAPEWSENLGFDYVMPLRSDLRLKISSNTQIVSKFVTYPAAGRPNDDNYQRAYAKTDLSLTLKGETDRWEVSVIGKNLSDKLTASNCSATNFAGGIVLGSDNLGGTTQGTMGWAEEGCFADGPGRTVWLKLTYRPFS